MSKKLKQFEFFKTQVETLGNENWDLGFNLGNAKRKLQLQEENLKHMNEEINILKHKMKNLKLEFEM
jgi:cob(I)alamin adenosyltransferase